MRIDSSVVEPFDFALSCAARTFYQWVVHGVDPDFFMAPSPRVDASTT